MPSPRQETHPMDQPPLPLSRFKVIDLTAHRAGPTCVRHLADWGAQVIRIEPPAGGDRDAAAGNRHGSDFQNLHRNKRAITLDLKSPAGREVFMKLAAQADVIVANMRPEERRAGKGWSRKVGTRVSPLH